MASNSAGPTARPSVQTFEGLASFGASGRPSDEEMAAFYLRHDNHWVELSEG